jgi:hypothetical protein
MFKDYFEKNNTKLSGNACQSKLKRSADRKAEAAALARQDKTGQFIS